MRKLLTVMIMALSMASSGATAQSNLVVVELFTSAGCSSCPPADELLTRLAEREDVLPLALHVDYWDYIGWKDQFGDPAFTKRQKAYAHAAGARSIYTPQMIIGGKDHVIGYRPMEVSELIARHSSIDSGVRVKLQRDGQMLRISGTAPRRSPDPMAVLLVRYIPAQKVKITRGENAGRTILYSNIVSDLRTVGEWSGARPLNLAVRLTDNGPVAVLVQASASGPILAAARLR